MNAAGTESVAVVQSSHHATGERTVPTWPSWTVREAARETGYHPEYIRRLCRQDRIEHTRAGNVLLIKISSLMRYMEGLDPADGRTGPK